MIKSSSFLGSAFSSSQAAWSPMTVVPQTSLKNGDWAGLSKVSPQVFFDLVTRDLPFADLTVTVDGPKDAVFNLYCKKDRRTIFHAEDCRYDGRRKSLYIAHDRDTDVRAADKGTGFGKVFLENILFSLPKALDIKSISMRAGREDGAFFWSRRGGVLFSQPDDINYRRFEATVRCNMEKLPQGIRDQAGQILAEPSVWANVRLANLPGHYQGRPVGRMLLENTNPNVIFQLDDDRQMEFVSQSLGDMESVRTQLRETYEMATVLPARKPLPAQELRLP